MYVILYKPPVALLTSVTQELYGFGYIKVLTNRLVSDEASVWGPEGQVSCTSDQRNSLLPLPSDMASNTVCEDGGAVHHHGAGCLHIIFPSLLP